MYKYLIYLRILLVQLLVFSLLTEDDNKTRPPFFFLFLHNLWQYIFQLRPFPYKRMN